VTTAIRIGEDMHPMQAFNHRRLALRLPGQSRVMRRGPGNRAHALTDSLPAQHVSATADVDDVRMRANGAQMQLGGGSKQLSNWRGCAVDSGVRNGQRGWSRRNTQRLVDGLYVELAEQLSLISTDSRLAGGHPQAQVP
jgi:hypothetical protein